MKATCGSLLRVGGAWALLTLLPACGGRDPGAHPLSPGTLAPLPRPPEIHVDARLERDGRLRLGGRLYPFDEPEEGAILGRELARIAAEHPLVLEAERGTPIPIVERLLALLEAAGIEDYRLDLGR